MCHIAVGGCVVKGLSVGVCGDSVGVSHSIWLYSDSISHHCASHVCSKIGEEQSPEDAEDGPPELLVRQ